MLRFLTLSLVLFGCSDVPNESLDSAGDLLDEGVGVAESVEQLKIGDRVHTSNRWRQHTSLDMCAMCAGTLAGGPVTTVVPHDSEGCTTMTTWDTCACETNPNPIVAGQPYLERCTCAGTVIAQVDTNGQPCNGNSAPPPGMPGANEAEQW